MQKNLLLKTVIIVAILLIFVYGMLGIPKSFSAEGLKNAMLDRVHLGLDLKGGTHLILQVMVNDAVGAQSDHAIEVLKDELQKGKVPYADIAKVDNQPEKIVIKGAPLDAASTVRGIVSDRLQEFDVTSGTENSWVLTMKPQVLTELKDRTLEQSIEAIRQRVDSLGVSEPLIQKNGLGDNQILVQLPGVDDPGRVKEIIQSTARLELREALDHGQTYPTEQAALQAHQGILPPNTVVMPSKPRRGEQEGGFIIVSRIPVVSGTDIRSADPGNKSDTNEPIVNFYLTAAAGKKFGTFTAAHSKDSADPSNLAIVLDNRVITAPSINSQINDSGIIEGGFTQESAKDLAMLLRSGALPASLHYLTERTVGPSLGADSIRAGVKAAIAGMAAVLIFMLIYYRGAGINADLALVLNLVILLGFMGFFGAVLTLPGIAGVILTVGMGVDSNVLIFERIREELRNGKAAAAAVDQGFDRAWTTILDTHVTTIVSALILFFVGTGPVSGFGLTLIFGLLANLFTAVFVSRVIFDAVLSRKGRGEALSI
ncbi:MAG TPA: protein translocase subunit SecD [Candidatus Angelobacter sp.]|jgi:preprotein translocase subunit SecD|nr:protein translocase subunit SecD [Candidatus Angelobacter sp.]